MTSRPKMAGELSILNHPPRVLEGPPLLHDLIRWDSNAQSCAIDFTINKKRHRYSYAEVWSCVKNLASQIGEKLDHGSQPNETGVQDIIPILLPQSPALYISQFAILHSGAAFCPINLDAPRERIKFVVRDVAAKVIITTAEFKDMVSWEAGPQIILIEEFPELSQTPSSLRDLSREIQPTDLAYVMYTSGSSGQPKGVGVSHLAASQSLLAHETHIPSFQRFLQFAAPSFDVSVFEIFFPLTRGCALVGCNRSQLLNDLPGMINTLEVDAAELTPTVAGSLLETRANAPGLKLLLTIGEMLTRPVVEEFGGSETKGSILYGMYGPTEAAIHCCINPAMEASAKPGNIGVPFDTVSVYVATAATNSQDAQMLQFLPLGELGELILGGPQLARGYLNRAEQNMLAFVTYEGNFYYRTGDKAKILQDGTIEIHGRISAGQVKLRGQRVELGEVEDAVYKHPGIKTVVAAVLGGVLVAFAHCENPQITSESVLEACSKWLPTFMVPSEVVLLRKFPYLPSGKVDKRALEADYQRSREEAEGTGFNGLTGVEKEVANVLKELLGPFSNNKRLSSAGLDSLMAIRAASKLRSLGYEVTTIEILQADTLGSLARLCERPKPKRHNDLNNEVKSNEYSTVKNETFEDVECTLPCTPLQSAMLAETALDDKAYRNWVELEFPGINSCDQINSGFLSLAQHNSILRTGFVESQETHGYVQVVWKSLADSQVERVSEFNYDNLKDSLQHPFRIQILDTNSHPKVLMHIHHALYDAWSLELLLDDLDALLGSESPPNRPPFSTLVDGYSNGDLVSNSWSSKDYWRDHLADLDVRQIPNFHTREKPGQGLAYCRRQSSISTTSIETAAKRFASSPQSIFQAAYALVLSSYLGTSDISFGTVFSGRTLPIERIEDIAGPCLATLPIRVDIASYSTLRDLVQDLNRTNRKHLEHSTLPLSDIKAAAGVHPRQQFIDTLLIWQQTLHAHDHTRRHVNLLDTVDNLEFNLTLEIIPGTGNMILKANYQRAVFPESQIDILLEQLEQLVQVIIDSESVSVDGVFSHLSKAVLSTENENPETEVRAGTLSSPVERIAMEDPERPAIRFAQSIVSDKIDSRTITYSELNSQANQLAHYLVSQGVLPDELVCICMEKSIDMYVAILATAKIGVGYLPVTPDTPSQRLQDILKLASIKTIIIYSSLRPTITSIDGLIVDVDKVDFTNLSVENIPPSSSPGYIAYSIFTSGSTGTPKGVLVTQGNLLSNLDVLEDIYPTSKDARLLQSCSQAFDVSVFEIFFTWRIGGCLCSATKDVLFRDIENAIQVMEITHLSLTPTVAALIDPENVPKVQFLVTAGEAVTQKVFNIWADRGLYQGYGPSETTNICTVNPNVTKNDPINNIGRPLKNTSAFVLKPGPEFSLVPRGGEGEFCFGGSQVFRGYMDRSQEVGKIIEHPAYGRLYRSGDFGRLMTDGSLAFTGRKDDQVKVRGQRVELGEINNVMLRSKEVSDCVTMVIDELGTNAQRLICFWTAGKESPLVLECQRPDAEIIARLFSDLDSALPVYMIPSALVLVSRLPSTTQGKIDKRLLVDLYRKLSIEYLVSTACSRDSSSDHSWTELESQIAKDVAHITKLPLSDISVDTSFFSLGIDSISAISLASMIRQSSKRQVEISDILKFPSVVRLAERISPRQNSSSDQELELNQIPEFGFEKALVDSTIQRFSRLGKKVQSILPCTPLQEAMLSAAESSSKILYKNEVVFDVKGDANQLKSCWQDMTRRHEILRTCFVSTDSPRYAYAQVVLANHELSFDAYDWQLVDTDPPYSVSFGESGEDKKMVLSMHHAIYDGVALEILYQEIEESYKQQQLPPTVSFAPFLNYMASRNMEEADQFWESILKGCVPAKFQLRPAAPKLKISELPPHVQSITLLTPLSSLESRMKTNRTSLLAACHTAWGSLLSKHLQQSDVMFGNVVSGRTLPIPAIERVVAPCFNTIPVRLSNIHSLTYLQAFRKLQTLNADSLPFQLTSLRRLQSRFSPDGSRLFDTLFILQQPVKELNSNIWSIREDNGAMDFPLVCEVVPRIGEDTLEVILHSYTSVVSTGEATQLLDEFEKLLNDALENPRRQILSNQTKDMILETEERQMTKTVDVPMVKIHQEINNQERNVQEVIACFTDVPVETIGRNLSIFRLGIDSISTVQIATRLRKQGYNVAASDILEHPTVAELSMYLSTSANDVERTIKFDFEAFDKQHRDSLCARNDIDINHVEAVRPCTAVQNGMIAQTLHSNGQEYVNSIWMELFADVSLPKLKHAWKAVCQSHEMLRTGFTKTENSSYQFAMVTFKKEQFQLPWLEGTTSTNVKYDLLKQPWYLAVSRDNGKEVIRLTVHHALYDAQSLQMIFDDVANFYSSGTTIARPLINVVLGALLDAAESDPESKQQFWQKEESKIFVNRFPDLTPLHVSDPSAQVQEMSSNISVTELERLCRDNGVTMQAATQATWARLLAAYTGEASTTFGITLSGRSVHEDAEGTPFPSIVTLPIHCDVSESNAELLRKTVDYNASLHKHQFTPLTSIQKWAGHPEGKTFDTLFAFQKLPDQGVEVQMPWKIVREAVSVDYAVSLEVQPSKSGKLALRLTFKDDLIPIEQAQLLLEQYDTLLSHTLHQPNGQSTMAPDLDNRLLSITPAEHNTLPGSVSLLHEFVENGAKTWPDKIALEFATRVEPGNLKTQTWTYQEIDQEGNRVAQLLIQHGVSPGDMIAICFDKCAEASFAIIGVLKAGCCYVALDPNAPVERLKYIVEDSGALMILTAGKPGQIIKRALKQETVDLDTPEALANCSFDYPVLRRKVLSQDVSYCLYTSGTTGTPKGCLITHENAVQAMFSFQRLFAGHWTPESKWLQFASFHFDVSVLEQFWPWSVGICVASAPRDLIFEDIPGTIQRLGITHIDLTPSLARLLHPDDVPTLWKGVFITGGEQLKQEILDLWGEKACIYNGYGPTEATIGCTMYPRVPANGKPSNIGPQFENVGSFVLKPNTCIPVLRGAIGELCVSGKLVGKGYLNRPDLTTEKFPSLKAYHERVYRTGDLVRILHNGDFIFLGRADDQVKLRGQRLELTEINEVIKKSIKGLQEVVTLVLKHRMQQKEQLVTFFVALLAKDANVNNHVARIKDACNSRLPAYMVPTHFIPIQTVPLNANNKADSKQLAAMYNDLGVDQLQKLSQSSWPDNEWNDREKSIVTILANAMQVEVSAVTRGSNIFELGLDSISIIGFSRTLQRAGLDAKLSVVKSNASIAGLVIALLEGVSSDAGLENAYMVAAQRITAFSQKHLLGVCTELGVGSTEIEAVAPCTPVQEGMIYRFLESAEPLYFNKFYFRICEGVDTERLLLAWSTVMSKLQILRTKFVETNDGYAQVVLKPKVGPVSSFNDTLDDDDKASVLKKPFRLKISTSDRESNMSIQIFHGLYDGNSLTMLLQRAIDEYKGMEPIDYGPSFQSILPYGPLLQANQAKEFWTGHLQDWAKQPLPLGPDSTRDVVANLKIENLVGFDQLRKKLGVSHQSIIQATWLAVLQTITTSNLALGIITSGRAINFDNAEKVIGPLFNTVPFYINIENGVTAAKLIERCHIFNMQMQEFQHTPLRDIQSWSPANRGDSLFDTLFVFQRPENEDEGFADGVWDMSDNGQGADYPLAFEATLRPDNTVLDLVIVAQGSYISQIGATELLQMVERHLRLTLESAGGNTIEVSHNEQQTNASLVRDISLNDLDRSSDIFTWTEPARILRLEISNLANVPEGSIYGKSSIFELGLDSIDVIKLSSRLRRQGLEIPVSSIIKSQTISKIAKSISRRSFDVINKSKTTVETMSRAIKKSLAESGKLAPDTDAVLPATPLQQSMVNEMLRSRYKLYFNIEAFMLEKGVDRQKLMAAVDKVIEHSPILRTTFVAVDDPELPVSYAQVVHKSDSGYTKCLTGIIHLLTEQTFESFMSEFRTDSVNSAIKNQNLLQIRFINDRAEEYMVMAISHALYDGTSLRNFHQDVADVYNGRTPIRRDYVPFLEHVFQSSTAEAKDFWKTTLLDLPAARFPRKSLDTQETRHHIEKHSRVSLKSVEDYCKSFRITMQTLGQACWSLVLSHIVGQLDVVFGSVLTCRDTEEANEVMFPLMNTVAVRSVIHGSSSDLLRYMQDMGDAARQYQHFPLGTAQAYAHASRLGTDNDSTLFDTLFIYQGRRAAPTGKSIYKSVTGTSDVEFPVCVELEIVDQQIVWTAACKSVVCSAEETEQLIESLETVLTHITTRPSAQVIESNADGISVCGLPRFRKAETPNFPARILQTDENEWTELELKIREALHQISKVREEEIRRDSTIFQLGLDSILILKLPALLRAHDIHLKVSDIIKQQTVSAMANVAKGVTFQYHESLDINGILERATASIDIRPQISELENKAGEIQEILPVTSGQLFTIRHWQASRGALFYPTFAYVVRSRVNKARLERAWRQLTQRHSILRTGFIEVGKDLVQVVFRAPHNDVIYCSQGSAPIRRHDLAFPPINLIFEEAKDVDAQLKLVVHHALYDGICLPVLIRELQFLYCGDVLPLPALQFRDFVARSLHSKAESAGMTSTKERWQSYLKPPTPPLKKVPDLNNERIQVFHPSMHTINLRNLARDSSVSLDALFLSAIAKIYALQLQGESTDQTVNISHVIFGIYLANRAPFGVDLTSLTAPTLNLLPLLVENPLERSINEISQYIQRDLRDIGSLEMSSASLDDIYQWTGARIGLFVNILKNGEDIAHDTEISGIDSERSSKASEKESFQLIDAQDMREQAAVVEEVQNEKINLPSDGRCDAFLPSIDIEIRYREDKVDMGIFAPKSLLGLETAEKMVDSFISFWI